MLARIALFALVSGARAACSNHVLCGSCLTQAALNDGCFWCAVARSGTHARTLTHAHTRALAHSPSGATIAAAPAPTRPCGRAPAPDARRCYDNGGSCKAVGGTLLGGLSFSGCAAQNITFDAVNCQCRPDVYTDCGTCAQAKHPSCVWLGANHSGKLDVYASLAGSGSTKFTVGAWTSAKVQMGHRIEVGLVWGLLTGRLAGQGLLPGLGRRAGAYGGRGPMPTPPSPPPL